MEKPAITDHPIHDLIRRRWSPRAFAARPVEAEKVASLFEAARWGAVILQWSTVALHRCY